MIKNACQQTSKQANKETKKQTIKRTNKTRQNETEQTEQNRAEKQTNKQPIESDWVIDWLIASLPDWLTDAFSQFATLVCLCDNDLSRGIL